MKPIKFIQLLFAFAMTSLLLSSCGEDGPGLTEVTPKLDFVAGSGIITSDASVNVGQEFKVNVVGSKGTNDLKTITIEEAGTRVVVDRVTLSSGGGANPILLSGSNASSFDIVVTILAHTDVAAKTYTFILEDVNGLRTSKSLTITTIGTPPTIVTPPSQLVFDSIAINGLFSTEFDVKKGTSDLKTVEFLINDVKATDLDRIFFVNSTSPITSNPFDIPTADKAGFKRNILLRAPATAGTYKYTIKFTDATGLSSSVNLIANVGTGINKLVGVLLNQAGPTGTGGLDLDNGAGTGSSNANAEIRDEGIVNNQTDPTWKQQISGINGSVIKYIKKGQNGVSESFAFDGVKLKEQISGLWTNGVDFNMKSSDQLRDVSAKVAVGDIFIVKKGEKYYLLNTKSVKVTNGDNDDSYTFDVKF